MEVDKSWRRPFRHSASRWGLAVFACGFSTERLDSTPQPTWSNPSHFQSRPASQIVNLYSLGGPGAAEPCARQRLCSHPSMQPGVRHSSSPDAGRPRTQLTTNVLQITLNSFLVRNRLCYPSRGRTDMTIPEWHFPPCGAHLVPGAYFVCFFDFLVAVDCSENPGAVTMLHRAVCSRCFSSSLLKCASFCAVGCQPSVRLMATAYA